MGDLVPVLANLFSDGHLDRKEVVGAGLRGGSLRGVNGGCGTDRFCIVCTPPK
jgi:hypothetical protein